MKPLDELPTWDEEGHAHVVIESPRGSHNKLVYEPKLGVFTLSRPLVLGVCYPFDWGFVPSTCAPDGDPLDAMVLIDGPTYPGVVLTCELIGVIEVEQNKKKGEGRQRNDRLLAVPTAAPRHNEVADARSLPRRLKRELEEFFRIAVSLEDKDITILGWGGPFAARALVEEAHRARALQA